MSYNIGLEPKDFGPQPDDFRPFQKLGRWSRKVIISEKLDGTNGQVYITDDGRIYAGSRTRYITPEADNHGFAKWVDAHKDELIAGLGPGRHYGEWWGAGIQRKYNIGEKRFSLFNTERWTDNPAQPRPSCCHVVPVLWEGSLDNLNISAIIEDLRTNGSKAAPGFMQPEGIVLFHTATGTSYKKTIDNDEIPKSLVKEP